MKIRLSKADSNTQFIVLVIALLLLWIPAFIHIQPFVITNNFFFGLCFGWISEAPIFGVILAFLLVCLNLFLLLRLLEIKHLKSVSTIYPAIIYLIFISNISTFQLTPELIACTLLLLSFYPLFSIGEITSNDNAIFMSSAIIGTAVLFYPSLWICLLLPIIATSILETISFRKILLSLLGSSFVWIWLFAILFLTDSLSDGWMILQKSTGFSLPQFLITNNWLPLISLSLKTILTVFMIFLVIKRFQNDVVINRRRMIVNFICLALLVIGFFNANNVLLHDNLLVLPETLLISYLYEHSKKVKLVGFLIFVIFSIHLVGRWMMVF